MCIYIYVSVCVCLSLRVLLSAYKYIHTHIYMDGIDILLFTGFKKPPNTIKHLPCETARPSWQSSSSFLSFKRAL